MKENAVLKIRAFQDKALSRILAFLDSGVSDQPLFLALEALTKLPQPGVRQKIVEIFRQFPDEEAIISSIGEIRSEDIGILLATRVNDPKAKNRDIIVEKLAKYDSSIVFETLKALLSDKDRHVRYQAIQALFSIGGREAALALCQHIADPDEWISMTILKLLCQMKEHETIPYLQEQFSRDPDIRRKAIMVSFLSMFRSVTLVSVFDEGLRSNDPRLRANAIEAIGDLQLPQREIDSRILPFLKDSNNRIRANTILALTKSEPQMTRNEIHAMVESNDISLRRSAAFIIGRIPTDGYEDLALKLLRDPSDEVRRRMVLSLRRFYPDFARTQLENSVNDPNIWIRKYSIDFAAEFAEFPKASILKHLKTETAAPNLVSCLNFFARHPDAGVIRLAKQRIKDKRPAVVTAAMKTIAGISGLDGLISLFPQINSKDPEILKNYMGLQLTLGNPDNLDHLLEKATQTKRLPQATLNLPALAECLQILNLGDMIPEALKEALEKGKTITKEKDSSDDDDSTEKIVVTTTSLAEETSQEAISIDVAPEEEAPETEEKAKAPGNFTKGVRLYNIGKLDKAREVLLKCLEEAHDFKKPHYFLGRIALEAKDYNRAQEALLQYLEFYPDDLKAGIALVKVFKALRNWSQLLQLCERMLPDSGKLPQGVRAKYLRDYAISLYFSKEYRRGQEILEALFQEDTPTPEVCFYLAMAHFQQKNFSRAEELLQEVMKIAPRKSQFRGMAENSLVRVKETLKK